MSSTPRVTSEHLWSLLPRTSQAVVALSATADHAGLDPNLVEMVNLRCSQLNGCAYCVNYHTELLLKAGIAPERLALIAVWEEAGIFGEREEAAFAWAEELTLIARTHVPDAAYAAAAAVFSETDLAALTVVIATINVWNRFAVPFRFAPEMAS